MMTFKIVRFSSFITISNTDKNLALSTSKPFFYLFKSYVEYCQINFIQEVTKVLNSNNVNLAAEDFCLRGVFGNNSK